MREPALDGFALAWRSCESPVAEGEPITFLIDLAFTMATFLGSGRLDE
jgi:hypothetical protein